MNCPKCGEIGQGLRLVVHGDATRTKMWCENCGWSSEYAEALVEASPAYRKAQLEAKGAKPGWYGPDGGSAAWSEMLSCGGAVHSPRTRPACAGSWR